MLTILKHKINTVRERDKLLETQVKEQMQIQVRMSDSDIKGSYANLLEVKSASKEEFCLDFLNIFPPVGAFTHRIIVSPGHLKRMSDLLSASIKAYESQYGPLEPTKEPQRPLIVF